MISEIGHFVLFLALIIAIIQAVVPMVGALRQNINLMAIGNRLAVIQFLLVTAAFTSLIYAFVISDFSLLIVYNNSHTLKPLLYKISGVWGNHEGSMLLWVLILSIFGAAVAIWGKNLSPTFKARVLSIQSMIGVAFLAFILFTSNPFLPLYPVPSDGRGLNPILQDPGLAFHPPLLYLGYVGFSMAFSFAVAALIEGRIDTSWGRWVRPWTLTAWVFLTAGIALGSWWAYYELGWGGWWFWDPVENASFMPWLLGTALLHSSVVVEKRESFKNWTILLAILTFSMSLLGTFLVRSGVLTSVHTFATDPERGLFILLILFITIGGALGLFALRAPMIKNTFKFAPISRESALLYNNLFLTLACAVVLLGTLYPLLLEFASNGKSIVSVGPPYFNITFLPIMIPLVAAIAIGPMLSWKRGVTGALNIKLLFAASSCLITIFIVLILVPKGPMLAACSMGLAAWITTGCLIEWASRIRLFHSKSIKGLRRRMGSSKSANGMTLAHLGIAILIVGITGASAWQTEITTSMAIGETIKVKDYSLTLKNVEIGKGPNYHLERGTFSLTKSNNLAILMYPERRYFPVAGQATTEAAIKTTLLADFYMVIGESRDTIDNNKWTVRFYINPMMFWLWLGVAVMVFGGLLSLSDRRSRISVPSGKEA
jgi:cytochrome c-type biogenesis protein CcmF